MISLNIDTLGAREFLEDNILDTLHPEAARAQAMLLGKSGPGNDFLGWLDLPHKALDELAGPVLETAARLSGLAEVLVVTGIGGSYLGARAVIEALSPGLHFGALPGAMQVVYAGHHMGAAYHERLFQYLDRHDYAVCVISKSGTTTEPALAFRLLRDHIEHKYGREGASQRIVAITDSSRGALRPLATEEGYDSYVIPDDVGGRFSVLSPVGLLPVAAAGGNIVGLLEGALRMQERCFVDSSFTGNPAMEYAAIRNALYRAGYPLEVLASFVPELQYTGEWFKQLFGESEGKGGQGIFPASVSFSTDLHSMGQYIQDGRRELFETFISVGDQESSIRIPGMAGDPDQLNYLEGRSYHDINMKAQEGTILAHRQGKVPVIQVSIPRLDAGTLGELIYFFEFACGVSAYMLGVNPFDQPGVEDYKRNMFALLGKPGYEGLL